MREYHILSLSKYTTEELKEQLNMLGSQGWRVVCEATNRFDHNLLVLVKEK